MGRFLGLLIAFILVVPLIRMVMGALGRLFTNYVGGSRSPAGPVGSGAAARSPAGGTLRKDPVCGTYVSEAVAQTHVSHGTRHYFCGEECKKKFLERV